FPELDGQSLDAEAQGRGIHLQPANRHHAPVGDFHPPTAALMGRRHLHAVHLRFPGDQPQHGAAVIPDGQKREQTLDFDPLGPDHHPLTPVCRLSRLSGKGKQAQCEKNDRYERLLADSPENLQRRVPPFVRVASRHGSRPSGLCLPAGPSFNGRLPHFPPWRRTATPASSPPGTASISFFCPPSRSARGNASPPDPRRRKGSPRSL